jgi:glycosyltransferase involved in cell wall biosynthesis
LEREVILRHPDLRFEVIFVDDGSGDHSLAELMQIRSQWPDRVAVIKLSRNFGQVAAIRAGFEYCRGRCVVTMSADGQDPAGLINDMLEAHFRDGCEVVIAERQDRDESAYRVITSRLFYTLMRKLNFPRMPRGGFDFALLGRKALQAFLRQQESRPFLQGQILWLGFSLKVLQYTRRARRKGRSRWSFGRKLTYLIDGLVGYSFLPIRLVSVLGSLVALAGFVYALVIIYIRLVHGLPVKGWAPFMVVLLVLGGVQMITLGIFGEYVWRILAQVQNRPLFVVEDVYPREDKTDTPSP